jgi:hypothetical protein
MEFERYKRNDMEYDCHEAKYKQKITVNFVIKFAQAGDWICYPIDPATNERIDKPFIAQPEYFYKSFKRV